VRITVGLSAIARGVVTFAAPHALASGWTLGLLEILGGVAVVIGILTPITSACAALGYFAVALKSLSTSGGSGSEATLTAAYLVVLSIALVLVGPGSFSLDARLFGRREIIIPAASRPPSS
jgi:uncharacterized membrane protein YphA (DoxX/SURF4 family)